MNQLSLIAVGRVTDHSGRSGALTDFAVARARLRAARASGPACHWRRDPATGALHCTWTFSRGGHEPASPVPLCLAS